MKLTQNELKLVSETIANRRRSNVFSTLHLAILGIIFAMTISGRIVVESPDWLMPTVVILLVIHVVHLRRNQISAEKLADILSRYVHRDAETITQLSESPSVE